MVSVLGAVGLRDFVEGSPAVQRWVEDLGQGTMESYLYIFIPWLRWLEENGGDFARLSPDELVAWQRGNPSSYELVDLLQAHVRGLSGRYRMSSLVQVRTVIRSFFLYNRVELPRDKKFRPRSEVPKVVGTLVWGEVVRMVRSSNPMYRAVFLCMFQGGMDVDGLLRWSDGGLESVRGQLEGGRHPLRIDLPGRKRNKNVKPFYTFLGRDAVDSLKIWLRKRPRVDHGSIFVTQFGTPLSESSLRRYWLLRLERLGLIERRGDGNRGNRYGKNLHEMRDVFRSRWRPSGCDIEIAEFFMGHDLDKLGYDKSPWHYPDWFEEQYLTAEPWLNILSEDPERVPVRDFRRLERELKEAREVIRDVDWLLGDPEAASILRGLVEERRGE